QRAILLPQENAGHGSRMTLPCPCRLDRFPFRTQPATKERAMRRHQWMHAAVPYLSFIAGGCCRWLEQRRVAARGLCFSFHRNALEEPGSDQYRYRHPAHCLVRIVVGDPGRTPSAYHPTGCAAEGNGEAPEATRLRPGRRLRRDPGRIRITGFDGADREPDGSGVAEVLTCSAAGVRRRAWVLFGVAAAVVLTATPAVAQDYSFLGDWPTHHAFADGTDFGVTGLYQYDVDDFSHDDGLLGDAHTNRRKYFGAYVRKKGVYDAIAQYDFQSKKWQDVFLRMQSKALFGRDIGAFRIGYSKTPVGFEGNTSTPANTFIEQALPTQAVYENRRIGVDWAWYRPTWLAQAGYYDGG